MNSISKVDYDLKRGEILKRMEKLGIDIEIKSLFSKSNSKLIYGSYSIEFDGKNSCREITGGHNPHYDKSEIIDIVCEHFKLLDLWREGQNLKS
jgi:hypothetical protein